MIVENSPIFLNVLQNEFVILIDGIIGQLFILYQYEIEFILITHCQLQLDEVLNICKTCFYGAKSEVRPGLPSAGEAMIDANYIMNVLMPEVCNINLSLCNLWIL
jgi:hypothetical protein